MINNLIIVLAIPIALMAFDSEKQDQNKREWISLFNGKNLEEWKIKVTGHELNDNYANTFRVEDEILKVAYDNYEKFNGKFGHIFYEAPFADYILRFEYRFLG
ncbi:MAG: hypothetical protein CMG31_01625, partial [Candidatus Marinimicrobia bacterium]|nr:hypothetical protein [Candidatus Neomarinimicrobiota bacterium]